VMTSPPRVMIDTKNNKGEALHQGQDDQVVGFKTIKCKGHLKNELDKGARGVEVDGRGDNLRRDSESLLSDFSFSQIQVPQVWMEGNYAR